MLVRMTKKSNVVRGLYRALNLIARLVAKSFPKGKKKEMSTSEHPDRRWTLNDG